MFNPAAPVSATNQPSNLKPGELEQLAQYQATGIEQRQIDREASFNGGAAPAGEMTQKDRVAQSWTHNNIHNGSK